MPATTTAAPNGQLQVDDRVHARPVHLGLHQLGAAAVPHHHHHQDHVDQEVDGAEQRREEGVYRGAVVVRQHRHPIVPGALVAPPGGDEGSAAAGAAVTLVGRGLADPGGELWRLRFDRPVPLVDGLGLLALYQRVPRVGLLVVVHDQRLAEDDGQSGHQASHHQLAAGVRLVLHVPIAVHCTLRAWSGVPEDGLWGSS